MDVEFIGDWVGTSIKAASRNFTLPNAEAWAGNIFIEIKIVRLGMRL